MFGKKKFSVETARMNVSKYRQNEYSARMGRLISTIKDEVEKASMKGDLGVDVTTYTLKQAKFPDDLEDVFISEVEKTFKDLGFEVDITHYRKSFLSIKLYW